MIDVIGACTSAIRGAIVPRPGYKLAVADWASIEARIAAWKCQEEWKLEIFRNYDCGKGPDSYITAFCRMFGWDYKDVGADSKERQIGKVSELAFQFNGSVAALVVMCATYRVDVFEIISFIEITDCEAKDKAKWIAAYAKKSDRLLGFTEDEYLKLAYLVALWRLRHSGIVAQWGNIQHAMDHMAANYCIDEGKVYEIKGVKVSRIGRFCNLHLDSGRMLMYPDMKLNTTKEGKTNLVFKDSRKGWVSTYGGKLFENYVQATNAELIKPLVCRLPWEGLYPILTIYDEPVCETQRADGVETLCEEMCRGEWWSKGLPLAAKGKLLDRYQKI